MAHTHSSIARLLYEVSYPGLTVRAGVEGPFFDQRLYLSWACPKGSPLATDNETSDTGAAGERGYSWYGRKWRLSPHMTDGEIVQTAWLALITALEHEAREKFKFKGTAILDPHYDIHKLVALRKSAFAIKGREARSSEGLDDGG